MSAIDQDWEDKVRALGPDPADEELGALLGDLVHQATSPGRVAYATYSQGDEALGRRLLAGLDFVGLLGALYGAPAQAPTARAWVLGHLVEAELHLRGQLGARLREALFDRGPVEQPPMMAPTERRSPERRVCDEAYLLLRSLFHPEEDAVGFMVERDAFLNLSEADKDLCIQQALAQGKWNLSPFELRAGTAP